MDDRKEFVKSAMQGLLSNPTWMLTIETKELNEDKQLEVLYDQATMIADYFLTRMKADDFDHDKVNKIMEQKEKLRTMRGNTHG